MDEIRVTRLAVFTMIISIFGLTSLLDDDISALFLIAVGFVYATALYLSLKITLNIKKYILGLTILGICNIFVYFSSAILMLAPSELAKYMFFIPPSILGAAITLLVLWKIWRVKSVPSFSVLTLVFIAIISILSPLIVNKLEQSVRIGGFTGIVINSLLWCVAFTLGIAVYQYSANKALKTDAVKVGAV